MSEITNITADVTTLAAIAALDRRGTHDANNPALLNIVALGKKEYEKLGWVKKPIMDRQIRKALDGKFEVTLFGRYGANKEFKYNKLDIKGNRQALVFLNDLGAADGTTDANTHLVIAKEIAIILYGLSGQLKANAKKAKEDLKKEVEDLNKALQAFNPDHKVKGASDVSNLGTLTKVVTKKAKASVGIKEDNASGTNMVSKGAAWASAKVVCGKDNRIVHNKEEKVFFVTTYVVPGTTWYKAIAAEAIPAEIDFEVMQGIFEEFKYE